MIVAHIVALVALVVFAICVLYNMVSRGIVPRPARAADPAHHVEAQEAGIFWNPLHFIALVLMILCYTIVYEETPYIKNFYALVRGGVTGVTSHTTAADATISADLPDPTITFDPATGELKAIDPLPPDCVLVVKYDSKKSPLKGDQLGNGRDLGPGTTWKIPKDALLIETRIWNKKENTVTDFVPVL